MCILVVVVDVITQVVYDVNLLLISIVHCSVVARLLVRVLLGDLCTLTWDEPLRLLSVSTDGLGLLIGLERAQVRRCIESSRVVVSISQILLDVAVVNRIAAAALADAFKNFFINFRLRSDIQFP